MYYAQTTWGKGPGEYEVWMARAGQWMVFLAYLPCLVMVLMRPNSADKVDRKQPERSAVSGPAPKAIT